MKPNIDFTPGRVTLNDMDLNPDIPLLDQIDDLKEDLIQVNYNDEFIVDVGWYPEFDENGYFKIFVIEGFDWSSPVIVRESKSLKQLVEDLNECVSYIREKL